LLSRIRVLAGTAACLLLPAGSLFAHDPHDPFVLVAISPNYAVDQTMLAGSYGLTIKLGVAVIMKSTNGGVNWSVIPGLPTNANLSGLAFSPGYAQDRTIFVGSSGGLYQSTNEGSSWTTLSTNNLVSLALSPNFVNDNTLYVITSLNTIFKSTNRGRTLTPVSVPGLLTSGLTAIAISPHFAVDQTLLLGGNANGIFKSTDGGTNWNSVTVGLTLPMVTALAFSPSFASDRTAFAGTLGAGFLMSTSNGNSWTPSNNGLTDLNVSSLALSLTYQTDSSLWVTTAVKGAFESTTRGQSWNLPVSVPRQLSDLTTVHYQVLTAGPGVQLMGMFEGLWISANSGASWQYIDTLPTRSVRYINMSPNFARDQTVFVSTYGSGNLWSYNGGASWSLQNTGMQAPYTDGSGISPNFAADGIAFSGNHSGLQITNNRGATWTMLPGPGVPAYPRGFAVSPNFAVDQTVYIGTTSGGSPASPALFDVSHDSKTPQGLYVSKDAGITWNLSGLTGQGVISIAFSPAFAADNTAFAATQRGGAFKTTNNAATWTKLKIPAAIISGVAVVAVSPSFPVDHVVFAAGLGGWLYKSTDAGSTWSTVSKTKGIRILDLKLSPKYLVDQTLFAGTVQYGVMKSTDGGTTLSTITTFPDVFVTALGVSPNFANDLTLFAAGYHGLFKSIDGGSTWTYLVAPSRIEETRYVGSSLQEPPTITYQGLWSFLTSVSASTNGYVDTTADQDTAVLNFVGSGIRWVSWTGPQQGTASLELDSISLGRVSLTAATDQFQQTVWEQHGIPCGYHTFTITASPQTAQGVSLDAFDVWVDSCPFASYSNPASLAASSSAVGSTAGSSSVLLTTTGSWQAASNAPWLSIAPTSGASSALILYSYTVNTNQLPRTGTLTIAGLTFTVTQAGAGLVPIGADASMLSATSGIISTVGGPPTF